MFSKNVFGYLVCLAYTTGLASSPPTGAQVQTQINAAVARSALEFQFPSGDIRFGDGERLLVSGARHMRLVGSPAGTTLWFTPGGG